MMEERILRPDKKNLRKFQIKIQMKGNAGNIHKCNSGKVLHPNQIAWMDTYEGREIVHDGKAIILEEVGGKEIKRESDSPVYCGEDKAPAPTFNRNAVMRASAAIGSGKAEGGE